MSIWLWIILLAFGLIGALLIAGYMDMKNGVNEFDPWDEGGI